MKHIFRILAIAVLLTCKVFVQTDPVRAELDHIFRELQHQPTACFQQYAFNFC